MKNTRSLLGILGGVVAIGSGLGYLANSTRDEIKQAAQKEYQRGLEDGFLANTHEWAWITREDQALKYGKLDIYSEEINLKSGKGLPPTMLRLLVDLRGIEDDKENPLGRGMLEEMVHRRTLSPIVITSQEFLDEWKNNERINGGISWYVTLEKAEKEGRIKVIPKEELQSTRFNALNYLPETPLIKGKYSAARIQLD